MMNKYNLYLRKYSTHYFIINNLGRENTILDVGCNDGYIGANTDRHTKNTFYGIDYNPDNIKKAKNIYHDAAVYDLNTLRVLPWKKQFDVMVFGDVLEHLLIPEQVLKYFVKMYLKKGGTVIISFPNIASWRMRLKLLFGDFTYTETGVLDKTHLHFYTYKTARELARSAQLTIEKELGSTRFFRPILTVFPGTKTLFANNIILVCKK